MTIPTSMITQFTFFTLTLLLQPGVASPTLHTRQSRPNPSNFDDNFQSASNTVRRGQTAVTVIIGLAVGLGIGIPLILGCIYYCWYIRRKKRRQAEQFTVDSSNFKPAEADFGNVNAYSTYRGASQPPPKDGPAYPVWQPRAGEDGQPSQEMSGAPVYRELSTSRQVNEMDSTPKAS